jgi:ribose transport system substrate-binding protein
MPVRSAPARLRGSALLAVLAAGTLVFASACSSSSTSSASSAPAATGASAASQQAATKAEVAIQPFLKPPAGVGTTVRLTAKPPAGKHIIALSCTVGSCTDWRSQVAVAASALGWTVTGVGVTGAGTTVNDAVNTAVSEKPDAIIINGFPRQIYAQAAANAAAAHIPIVTQMGELQGAATPPFIAVQYQGAQFDTMAAATGNWVIADSHGTANALLVQYAGLPLSERITSTTQKTITSSCPACKTQLLTVQLAATGTTLPGAIVSAIQRNPSIDYVVLQDAAMVTGLDAALHDAGLAGKVKVLGNDTSSDAILGTVSGEYLGWMAFSLRAAAYEGIDAIARHLVGDPQQTVPLMNEIFTKQNLPANPTSATWENVPTDLAQQYDYLWRVSS